MLARLIKYALVAAVTVLFAVMWGLTIRANLPEPSQALLRPDYDRLLPRGQDERREVWDLYFEMFRVGESELTVRREDDGTLLVHSRLHVDVGAATQFITGGTGAFELDFRARISPIMGLTSFDAVSEAIDLQVFGNVRDDELRLTGNLGNDNIRTSLPFNENRVMGEILSPMTALPELSESQIDRPSVVELLNPLTGRMQNVTITPVDIRTVELAGDEVQVFRLRSIMGRSRWTSWVTEEGEVLIQGTPFGLRLQRRDLLPAVVTELMEAGEEPDTPAGSGST